VRLFCVARDLLDELLGAGAAQTSSRDKAVLDIWADGVGPEIRYCAHELGWEKAWDVESFVKALGKRERDTAVPGCADLVEGLAEEEYAVSKGKGKSEGRQRLEEVMWEGQPVPVRNPELVDVLLKAQDAEARLGTAPDQNGAVAPKGNAKAAGSKKGVAAYDAILNALSDAEEVARKLAEAQQLIGGTTTVAASNGRDIHFLHAFITYQLLSRRIQRDLLLVSALISSSSSSANTDVKKPAPNPKRPQVGKAKASTPAPRQKFQVDGRLFPAVVKLLDTILQSLGQMRTLSLVDDGIEISMAVDARLSFTRAKRYVHPHVDSPLPVRVPTYLLSFLFPRCLYLARCYIPAKKYAESLTLIQHANIHLRETRSILSSDPTSSSSPADYFYSLTTADLDALESDLFADGLQFKKDWFLYNGGASTSADREAFQKPLFFDIALNYVQLDVDRLQERAGKKKPTAVAPAPDKQQPVAKAKAEVEARPATPEPQTASLARGGGGGLATLLGGWWGRK
jgi:signal recognition particle subunit SRP68